MSNFTEHRNDYFYLIPKLGILSLLYLIEIYEEDENSEECVRITQGILVFNIEFGTNFPTRTCEDLEKEVREDYKRFGLNNKEVDIKKYHAYAVTFYAKQQELKAENLLQ
jgi:hypothetical protein